jgi:hypothetical protein
VIDGSRAMNLSKTGIGNPARAILLAVAALLYVAALATVAQTQDSPAASTQATAPQRHLTVQTNLVLVPVFVYDPARMAQAPKEEMPCARAAVVTFFKLAPTEPYLPKDCDVTEVQGLSAKDFRLFEDGVEQQIESFEAAAWRTVVRDNLGWHLQASATPRGIWSLSELSTIKKVPFVTTDFHILGYVPRDAKGGCHRIRVEVNRPNLLVFARDEYCGGQSPSDPLVGTGQGKELDRILASEKRGKISLSLQGATFYTGGDHSLVDLCLRFSSNDLYRKWDASNWTLYARIGVMGVIRRKDGTVAARFSDLLYPSYWPTFDQGGAKYIAWEKGTTDLSTAIPRLLTPSTGGKVAVSDSGTGNSTLALSFPNVANEIAPDEVAIKTALDSSDPFWLPTRYETQVDLPAGDYDLEVVLNDGWNFGRAKIPLTVEPYDGKQLALSSVALCKSLRSAAVAAKENAQASFAPQYVPLVSRNILFSPSGYTSFAKGESLFAYFEVYDPQLAENPAAPVSVHLRILDASTSKVKEDFASIDAASYKQAGSSVLRIGRKLPIDQLPTGAYRLEVQAAGSKGSTAWRAATFEVK